LLNRLAERVDFEAQMLGDVASAPTCPQQLLGLSRDLWRQHRSTTCRPSRVECLYTSGAILVDITNDTILRDAEDPHDIDLAARILAEYLISGG
jgi:hypothetical protein